jgi:hypothetical protein
LTQFRTENRFTLFLKLLWLACRADVADFKSNFTERAAWLGRRRVVLSACFA